MLEVIDLSELAPKLVQRTETPRNRLGPALNQLVQGSSPCRGTIFPLNL